MTNVQIAKSLQVIQRETKRLEMLVVSKGDLFSDSDLLNPVQVSELLGISKVYVYVLRNEGKLKGVKIGKYVLFSRKEVLQFKKTRK